ncbi:MAG: hypothetical protein ABI716_01075 [Candidatus Saccharibacteria bacterium]
MNTSVLMFFVFNVLAALLLGIKFFSKRNVVMKCFGVGLMLDSVAFAMWSLAVAIHPAPVDLEAYVLVGVVFFLLSLLAYLYAGIQQLNPSARLLVMVLGAVAGLVILYARGFMFPSSPSFSNEGFFFFNPNPIMQMLYMFSLAFTALPAISALASKFKGIYAGVLGYGLIAQVVGGLMLITSTDASSSNSTALYITGWVIGIVYLVLLAAFVFTGEAWNGSKATSKK